MEKRENGTLTEGEAAAPCDNRGREGIIRQPRRVRAPDGVSGDWGE